MGIGLPTMEGKVWEGSDRMNYENQKWYKERWTRFSGWVSVCESDEHYRKLIKKMLDNEKSTFTLPM